MVYGCGAVAMAVGSADQDQTSCKADQMRNQPGKFQQEIRNMLKTYVRKGEENGGFISN
jgi:hypothetical protein